MPLVYVARASKPLHQDFHKVKDYGDMRCISVFREDSRPRSERFVALLWGVEKFARSTAKAAYEDALQLWSEEYSPWGLAKLFHPVTRGGHLVSFRHRILFPRTSEPDMVSVALSRQHSVLVPFDGEHIDDTGADLTLIRR